jgi:hypothetical protein
MIGPPISRTVVATLVAEAPEVRAASERNTVTMRTRPDTLRPYLAAVLLASLLLHPSEARAEQGPQVAGPIAVGSKVRLLAPATIQGPIEGTVMEMDEESLLISTKDHRPLRVSWQAITQADVSTGRRGHALKGMLIGAPIGALLGAVYPLDTSCSIEQITVSDPSCVFSREEMRPAQ